MGVNLSNESLYIDTNKIMSKLEDLYTLQYYNIHSRYVLISIKMYYLKTRFIVPFYHNI